MTESDTDSDDSENETKDDTGGNDNQDTAQPTINSEEATDAGRPTASTASGPVNITGVSTQNIKAVAQTLHRRGALSRH